MDPKVYNGKDKTFFFFSYEGFRNRVGASSASSTVPTPEMYNGDFRKWVDAAGAAHDPDLRSHHARRPPRRRGHAHPSPTISSPKLCSTRSGRRPSRRIPDGSGVLKPNVGAAPGTVGYVSNNYLITSGTEVQPAEQVQRQGRPHIRQKDRISRLQRLEPT